MKGMKQLHNANFYYRIINKSLFKKKKINLLKVLTVFFRNCIQRFTNVSPLEIKNSNDFS